MTTDTFPCVRIEGSILPADLLQRVAASDARLDGLRVEDYGLVGEKVNEATNHAWNRLLAAWENFKTARETLLQADQGHKLTVERWLLPFWKVLGYTLDKAKPFVIDEKSYPISYTRHHSPFHLVSFSQDLDKRIEIDGKQFSPHGLVQEFLNRTDAYLWGFVSNGLKLRILRDNIRLTRQAYVEFDLQAIFDGKQYADFALLWRLCHESRITGEKPEHCWLERWSKIAAEQGLRALDQLRTGVENAVKALGRGFLACAANTDLKEALKNNRLTPLEYYKQLLRVVYRFLFVFVAEDRELLLNPDAPPEAKERYIKFYSSARLRRIAERLRGTPHTDLYEGFSLVLGKLGTTGEPAIALPALGGLFDPVRTPNLSGCRLTNADLLEAVRALSVINDGNARRSIDYRNLGAEELGSVYESLLELQPRFDPGAITFTLESASGNERKTTGSYYTPTSLITCLLDSALDPVLAEAGAKQNPEAAIMALKVCDPACGSGHFLIAAAHRIAKKLAAVRTFEEEPAPDAIRSALRDVIGHCIFGVDINPMAVELCQVALWMESLQPGKPLSFLDHHIQYGNSLLGTTPALLKGGIPDEAFEPIEGDEKKWCSVLKRQNKDERRGQSGMFDDLKPWEQLGNLPAAMAQLEKIPDDTVEGIHRKEREFRELHSDDHYRKSGHFLADAWCAAFVWKKVKDAELLPMTHSRFRKIEKNPYDIGPKEYAEVRRLAEHYQFFHWHIAFPGVFRWPAKEEVADNDQVGWCGGFDVVLGNPPWEMMELNEAEHFASSAPNIAHATSARVRQSMITELSVSNPILYNTYVAAKQRMAGFRHLIQSSGRFPKSSTGRINLYPLFIELSTISISPYGQSGMIVPSAISMDAYNAPLFSDLVRTGKLYSLIDFENSAGLFPAVHRSYRFCLLTVCGNGIPTRDITFCYFAKSVEDTRNRLRKFTLSCDDIARFSPNTLAPPILKNVKDIRLAKSAYQTFGVLVNHGNPDSNRWMASIERMLSLSDPGDLFRRTDELEQTSEHNESWVRLYCGKAIHQYDHRFATWGQHGWNQTDAAWHANAINQIMTEYRARSEEVQRRLSKKRQQRWLLSYRDVCRATDERTVIATVIPACGCDTTCRNIHFTDCQPITAACFLANLNAFAFDYFARQKVIGIHLGAGVFEQLPIIQPHTYLRRTSWAQTELSQWISSRVLELTYTAHDLKPFAEDLGYTGEPFIWNNDRRFQLRCELDAAFFHLYGISEDDTAYILDTFSIVRDKDIAAYGTYRTKDTILQLFSQYAQPRLTVPQIDMLRAMACVAAFVEVYGRRISMNVLETGLVLMVNDPLRTSYITNKPLSGRKAGRKHRTLLDWMPLAIQQLLATNAIQVDPNSPEGLPFYTVGPSPFGLTDLPSYRTKATEAIQVMKQIGDEQAARTVVEEYTDDPAQLIPV